jgi:polyphenol oxidase
MFIECNERFTIYFGDAAQSVSLDEITTRENTPALQNIAQQVQAIPAVATCTSKFQRRSKAMADKQIAFLRQEHGVQGKIIELHDDQNYIFQPAGDYLITQKINCGIGVVTADCLPIVIYDSINHATGIVHAGWKGLQAGVLKVVVADMIVQFGSRPEDLLVYLGPSAQPCCYEVQQDFVDQFREHEKNFHEFFIKKDGKIYFDSRSFIMVIARSLGIVPEKLYTRYNLCTICNLSFCSYRREKEKARRQVTMICLHEANLLENNIKK